MVPRVTVLMTVYNGLAYLREAVESVLCQTLKDFEFLIIDDASTDGSYDLIRSYKDPRIRLVRNEPNQGVSASMNRGIELARAQYVARIDQDDVCLPERLAEQLAYMEARPDLAIVCAWEYGIDSASRKTRNWTRRLENYGAFLGYLVVGKCPIWHPSIMFKRQVALKIGGFNHSYWGAEDFEMTMRLAMHRYNGGVVPSFLVMQRRHENSGSVQKKAAQWEMTQRAHDEMIRRFYRGPDAGALGQFLRMEDLFWKNCESKRQIKEIVSAFHEMVGGMKAGLSLSDEEMAALHRVVARRMGLGITWGGRVAWLPPGLFFPLFFCLSPMLIPGLRRFLTAVYAAFRELRYPGRFFRASIKRLVDRGV